MADPLLPIRHPEKDFFICDFGDVIPKSDIASMEHPLFTLSTKPDTTIRLYEHSGNKVEIFPSVLGLATIHDKDILIYCISQLMAGINKGENPSRTVRFKVHDLLVTTNRQTDGDSYKRFRGSLKRLSGTRIETNIKTNNQEIIDGFGIIDSYKVIVDDPQTKRMVELEITISEWLYNSVLGHEVLSINRDYFRLRKPIERRIYEIARKHCGKKKNWIVSFEILHKKVGSTGSLKKFKEIISSIVKFNHLPDYSIEITKDNIIFLYKNYTGIASEEISINDLNRPFLKPDTIEKAKKILCNKFDVYAIESDWIYWWETSGKPELKSPDGAFINFCKSRMEKTVSLSYQQELF
jgi:Replication initiator protein A